MRSYRKSRILGIVTVAAVGLLAALGPNSEAQDKEHEDNVATLIRLSGYGDRVHTEAEKVLELLKSMDFEEPLRSRQLRILAGMEEELTEENCARVLVPVYQDLVSGAEAVRLTELYKDPLLQRWISFEDERTHEASQALDTWRRSLMLEFYQKLAGLADAGDR